ncbi:MAG: SBBP repeat-containing protein, partial [Ignavibacteria bacterium]|nr:SBBP repeat-containing protein [Ignavibacteria bacterium]
RSIAVDNSGNVYVTGSSADTVQHYRNITTIKYNSGGSVQWIASYNGPGSFDDLGAKVLVDNLGNVYAGGTSYGIGTLTDYVVIKYSSSGTRLWTARYNGIANSYDELVDMKQSPNGDIIVTGKSFGTATGEDYATIRINQSTGAQVWESRYNNPETGGNPDQVSALAVDINGDVIVTGQSYSTGGGWDFFTQKYSGVNGSQMWNHRYNGTADSWDVPVSICTDRFGNVFVAGMTYLAGEQDSRNIVIKYNSAGGIQWQKTHASAGNSIYPKAMTVDTAGNVYETISSNGASYMINLKLNGSSGNLLWQDNYNAGGYNDPVAIKVLNNGSIYVSAQTGSRTTTIKYSQQLVGIGNNNIIAEGFELKQNYPNPFNPATTISFTIVNPGKVKISVYDITGKMVSVLMNETKNAGSYEVLFNASNLSSGTYFYKIESGDFTDVKKMMLVK